MVILKHKKGSMNTNQIHELIRPNCENRGLECAPRLDGQRLSCCHGGFLTGPEKFVIFFNLIVLYLAI